VSGTDASRVSVVGFAVALSTVGVGAAVGLAAIPGVGTYVGMLAGAFLAGLLIEARPTVESGIAAVLAALGVIVAAAVPGNGVLAAILTLGTVNPVTLLGSVALSFAIGAFGGHFGDDLRDGLTESLPEPAPGAPTGTTGTRTATESVDEELTESTTDERPNATASRGDPPADRGDGENQDRKREDAEYELEDA
jgi:hypothetical protein